MTEGTKEKIHDFKCKFTEIYLFKLLLFWGYSMIIIVILFIPMFIRSFINLFASGSNYITVSDLFLFYGAYISAIGAFFLGYVAIQQNKNILKSNEATTLTNNSYLGFIESIEACEYEKRNYFDCLDQLVHTSTHEDCESESIKLKIKIKNHKNYVTASNIQKLIIKMTHASYENNEPVSKKFEFNNSNSSFSTVELSPEYIIISMILFAHNEDILWLFYYNCYNCFSPSKDNFVNISVDLTLSLISDSVMSDMICCANLSNINNANAWLFTNDSAYLQTINKYKTSIIVPENIKYKNMIQ